MKRTGPIPDNVRGYDPDVFIYQTDLAKAKELLLAGGLQEGDTLDYMIASEAKRRRLIAQLFQASLAEIGFNLQIDQVDNSTLDDTVYGDAPPEEKPNIIGSWAWWPDYNDSWNQLAPNFLASATGGGGSNAGNWVNDRFEAIMTEAQNFTDDAQLNALMKEAQNILTELDPAAIFHGQRDLFNRNPQGHPGFRSQPALSRLLPLLRPLPRRGRFLIGTSAAALQRAAAVLVGCREGTSMIVGLIIRRLLFLVLVLFGLSLITFTLSRDHPGRPGPADGRPARQQEQVDKIRREVRAERSLARAVRRLRQGRRPARFRQVHSPPAAGRQDLKRYLPATLEIGLYAFILSTLVGVPLGVASAVRRDSLVDHVSRFISITGLALPVFWLALMVQFLFFGKLRLAAGRPAAADRCRPAREITSLYTVDSLLARRLGALLDVHQAPGMPVMVLAYGSLAVVTRMVRGGMLEVLNQDYIRTARAKGLRNSAVVIATRSRTRCCRP